MNYIKTNEIINADCFCSLERIEPQSIDLIFIDPPYGMTKNKADVKLDMEKLFDLSKKVLKKNGVMICFSQGMMTSELMLQNRKFLKQKMIWVKNAPSDFPNANKRPMHAYEELLVFTYGKNTYNPQKTIGQPCHSKGKKYLTHEPTNQNYGKYNQLSDTNAGSCEKYITDTLYFPKVAPSKVIHPTQKNLDLCRTLVRMFSNPGDIVLDCCCGSGTIPLAAVVEGRRYIGVDNGVCDKKNSYFCGTSWADVSIARIEKYRKTGKL